MNVVITGHTSGLGKEIYNHFNSLGHKVTGLSRSNGFSIPEKIDEIVKIAKSCDLFFNNAHVGTAQADFIKKLFQDTMIVTSGSMSADYWETGDQYCIDKFYIEKSHKVCKEFTKKSMLLIKMGYLENYTDRISIPYSQVINAIDFWLQNPRISMIEFNNIR